MAFIGNSNTTQGFTPAIDYFNGNGSTTAFTLSRPVASVAQVQVVIENVPQNPGSAYTVSGNTITFTSAPPSGTSNIYVYYTSPITQVIASGQGTVGPTQLDVANGGSGTGAVSIPSGTTAQRPVSPTIGLVRYNTTIASLEVYNGSNWQTIQATGTSTTYNSQYIVVAGGGAGGGGSGRGGGGGAGGLLSGVTSLTVGTSYTVTIGSGGTGASNTYGGNGNNSVFGSFTATGGGGGGGGTSSPNINGQNGGSGGGAGAYGAAAGSGGALTSGQGYNGGDGFANPECTGGGGGAGRNGYRGAGQQPGHGGDGVCVNITGYPKYYSGGGGAAGDYTNSGQRPGYGGQGGGGDGAVYNTTSPVAGTANTGGGGGGHAGGGTSANGGSGVVIISIPTNRYSGTTTGSPTVTTVGDQTVLTFTSSGSYTA